MLHYKYQSCISKVFLCANYYRLTFLKLLISKITQAVRINVQILKYSKVASVKYTITHVLSTSADEL